MVGQIHQLHSLATGLELGAMKSSQKGGIITAEASPKAAKNDKDGDCCCCCCCSCLGGGGGGGGGNKSPSKSKPLLPGSVGEKKSLVPEEEETIEASTSASNLDQFLHHTTPKVQLQYLPKTCLWDSSVKRWRPRPGNVESIPFFALGDLWDTFDEWSAYGAGVPLVLNGKEEVVQYYVPYLSALQLYTRTGLRRCLNSRKFCHDSSESSSSDYRDSNSDVSSDNDSESSAEGISPIRTSFWKKCQSTGFCSSRGSKSSSLTALHEASSDDDEDNWEQKVADHLLLNYFEDSAPYSRVPLIDKISELERKFPEIRTLRSYELLPTSWFSIAWYPIYRIPTGPTLKDLGTCFLTFHSLSTPLQDVPSPPPLGTARLDLVDGSIRPEDGSKRLLLQSFGLGSYKLRGAFWTSAGNPEKLLASNLEGHADSWLKGLHVRHPDFDFFVARSPTTRR